MIYFIRIREGGPVKIGVSEDPRSRLSSLQSGHAQKLELWRLFDGGYADETVLHERFRPYRVEREWFMHHPDMDGDLGLREIPERDFPKKLYRGSRLTKVVALRVPIALAEDWKRKAADRKMTMTDFVTSLATREVNP